jgi:hypothetical protein
MDETFEERLQRLLSDHSLRLEYTMVKGCLCGSCNAFRVTDIDDQIFEGDSIREALDRYEGIEQPKPTVNARAVRIIRVPRNTLPEVAP